MAADGVGLAVLQLCRTVDNLVVFGTASAGKHDVLRAEGCTHPIDYHATDYAAEVRRLTGGEGVDVVLDPLGGNDWRNGLKLLRPGGRLVAYGFANLASGPRRRPAHMAAQVLGVPLLTPIQLMNQNRTVSGVNIGHLWGEIATLRGGTGSRPRPVGSGRNQAAHRRLLPLHRRRVRSPPDPAAPERGKVLLTP
jgi:NADPH:quinone reductase-like Zn-dependent oxidoreductase